MGKRKDIEKALAVWSVVPEVNTRSESLRDVTDNAGLAAFLTAERNALMERVREPARQPAEIARSRVPGGVAIVREFSDVMDALLARMFALACKRAGVSATTYPIVIVATGGYGRRELCPFSDIDITFIPQWDGDPQTDAIIRDMFAQVMDICIARCGLEVGYAYRLLSDCATLDHQTSCGLLDARCIAGSQRLFIQFEDAFWTSFNPAEFLFAKIAERRQMLQKQGLTPRVVEPNLKEGAGGLRDLQTAVWSLQAVHLLEAARVRGERAFAVLNRDANVSAADMNRLQAAKEYVLQVRNALHVVSGAERDQLVVTRQEDVAEMLGYRDIPDGKGSGQPAVEPFMARLYTALAQIRRVSEQVMRRTENSRLILGIGLDCKRRQIVPANESLVSDEADWLLWASEIAQRYDLEFSEEIEHAAATLVEMGPVLKEPVKAAQIFTRILSQTGKVYPTLQRMADLGILGWFVPEFGQIVNLIPYDSSHDFTIGQHTLYVMRNIEDLLLPQEGEEQDEMRRVLMGLPHPEQLMLAALLHDCGKAFPGRPHAEVGIGIAAAVCERLGWSPEAKANVCFLVAQHLLMAETSRLRDLGLEETIRDFTKIVCKPEHLNMLYILTYADTKAVGAGVWSQMKARFLSELWQRASAVLCEEEPVEYDDGFIARARRRLVKDLTLSNIPPAEIEEHIQAMPPNYLLSQSMSQIALHIGFIRRVRDREFVLDFHEEREATYTELTIAAYDDPQPGLLAKITGALYAAGLEVHSAQVLTRVSEKDRIALDTLLVDYRGKPLSVGKRREVEQNLLAVLQKEVPVRKLLLEKSKNKFGSKPGEGLTAIPQITVHAVRNDLSPTLTVVETDSPDMHSTLYFVSDALSRLQWDIHSARVSFWQGAARSSFYVAGARSLSEEDACRELEIALAVVTKTAVLP